MKRLAWLLATVCLLSSGRSGAADPDIRTVQQAAAARLGTTLRQLERLAVRARWASLAPEIDLRAYKRYEFDRSLSADSSISVSSAGVYVGPDDISDTISTDDDLIVSVGASWRLSGAVFRPEEVALARERQRAGDHLVSILLKVTDLYFEREELRRQCPEESGQPPDRKVAARFGQLTALLDGLTGHVFSWEEQPCVRSAPPG